MSSYLVKMTTLLWLVISLLLISQLCSTTRTKNYLCRRVPALNPQQMKFCEQSPHILSIIRSGIQMAMTQCERLFHYQQHLHSAWNCTSWVQNSLNRLYVNITDTEVTGTKEASFAHALVSAGVTYALSEACTKGTFAYCTCGSKTDVEGPEGNDLSPEPTTKSVATFNWDWNGCRKNTEFGLEMSRLFLDSHEQYSSSQYALMNMHNNQVGRKIVKEEYVSRCQCHGISGTCTMRTCWRSLNVFPLVVKKLYGRYTQAKPVTHGWLLQNYRAKFASKTNRKMAKSIKGVGNGNGNTASGRRTKAKLNWLAILEEKISNESVQIELNQPNPLRVTGLGNISIRKKDLVYVKPSVNYCHLAYNNQTSNNSIACRVAEDHHPNNNNNDDDGTKLMADGDDISETFDTDGNPLLPLCSNVCCGRGYRSKLIHHTERCDCEFEFCCTVTCHAECQVSSSVFECL